MSFAVAVRRVHIVALCGAVIIGFYCCLEKSEVKADDGKRLVIKTAFRHALARRFGDQAYQSGDEFQKLLEQWNPVGQTVTSLKDVVGEPESGLGDSNSIVYHFDTGWVAWEYAFSIEAGRVTKCEVND